MKRDTRTAITILSRCVTGSDKVLTCFEPRRLIAVYRETRDVFVKFETFLLNLAISATIEHIYQATIVMRDIQYLVAVVLIIYLVTSASLT